jgi:GEVED domain
VEQYFSRFLKASLILSANTLKCPKNRFLIISQTKSDYLLSKHIFFGLIALVLIGLGFDLYKRNILYRTSDKGDAPGYYGIATHYKPEEGPYFGLKRGNNDGGDTSYYDEKIFATADNVSWGNDEDAFKNAPTGQAADSSLPVFLPEILAENETYSITIPIKEAEPGDPVRGWIDFNGNGKFEKNEKASAWYTTGSTVSLNWVLPFQLNSKLTYARLRTCKKTYEPDLEFPDGEVKTGEVEDYVVRIVKSLTPSSELRDYIDFNNFYGTNGLANTSAIINKMKLGEREIAFKISGTAPEMIGINNMHEASITGLRLGHDAVEVGPENPIILTLKTDSLVEDLNFQLIDIDGGDRIKIEGFRKGTPVSFSVSNITDNYFYQFNDNTNEIYSEGFTDAGNDSLMPSSLDMAINIFFKGFVDSVKLTYSDEVGTGGSFSACNFSVRRHTSPPVFIQHFNALENADAVDLSWTALNYKNVKSYVIERSNDGVLFEVAGQKRAIDSLLGDCTFKDSTLPPVIQSCYYRIKIVEKDNHTDYSPLFRMRRNIAPGLTGFKPMDEDFTSVINIKLLVDMPGGIDISLYDYQAKRLSNWTFADKKQNDILSITGPENLPEGSYYIQVLNQRKKYLHEVFKEE